MRKFSDMFGQEVSRRVSKATTDAVWTQENGTDAYSLSGKIFVGCGVVWLLISLIPIVCKNPMSDYIWMWILAIIQIVSGTALVILSKKSKNFQKWANKDFEKSLKEREKLEEKVTVGKVTLPVTNGDVLALKILSVIAILIFFILGIGYWQGWVVW